MTTPPAAGAEVWPEGRVGPFLPMRAEEVELFNDLVSDEVDSFFSTSIACCDRCYPDFKRYWPDTAFRQMEFQTQSMGAEYFVRASRLPEVYSVAEISTLAELVQCPRCLEHGACNIWLYEHGFEDAAGIEHSIDELTKLGQATPFILLEHPFAQRVLAAVKAQYSSTSPYPASASLFRARSAGDVTSLGQDPAGLDTYAPPPAAVVKEGRFNHAGAPMLYLASTAETAAAELGSPGAPCLVGELELRRPLRVLNLVDVPDGPDEDLFRALSQSALLAAPLVVQGWVKREYVFSRFLADCARYAGFDAIKYGSTKQTEAFNIVVLDPGSKIDALASLRSHLSFTAPVADTRY